MHFPPRHLSSTHPRRPRHGHYATPYDRHHHPAVGSDHTLRSRDSAGVRKVSAPPHSSPSTQPTALPGVDERTRHPGPERRVSRAGDRPTAQIRYRGGSPRSKGPQIASPSPGPSSKTAQDHRYRSRDHARGRPRRRINPSSPVRDLDPRHGFRGRKAAPPPEHDTTSPHHPSVALDVEDSRQFLLRSSSPAPSNRQRSRGPSRAQSPLRNPRREPSPSRPGWGTHAARQSSYIDKPENSSISRQRSLTRREQWLPYKEFASPPQRSLARKRSPSPGIVQDSTENPNLIPLGHRRLTRRSRSPPPSSYNRRHPASIPQRWTPPPGGRGSPTQGAISTGHHTLHLSSDSLDWPPPPPPESPPRERRRRSPQRRRRRRDIRDRSWRAGGAFEPASGANSTEIDMSGRGNFRGAYGGQYSVRGPYNQSSNDPRNFSNSPTHAASGSSFQTSPPAQSSYPNSRGSWSGQQQSSPPNQFQSQYSQNGYTPTAPAAHFQGSQANSPPIGTPTGPSAQFSSGRGYRGSSGGFHRGNSAGSGRGGGRGGFKSGHWGSGGSGSRAASSQPDDTSSGRATPQATSTSGEHSLAKADAGTQEGENPFRPPKDLQVEDSTRDDKNETKPMPPPNRQPPTGPAAEKKISFALKSAPKAPVATPKLEISSKFSAPARREPPNEPSRHDHPRDVKSGRDRDSLHTKQPAESRDLPRNVPTEPRAAKAAGQQRQQRQEHHREQAPRAPRVRMVKKKMKRLKPRPTLPDDLIGSDSVYFRKPGNESVIGAGTYGKVFKALHVYTKNLVALKRIRMEGERDGFPVTAVREIKLLQSLRHINIVALLEVMVERNECYMVFEYMSHDLTGLLNHPTFKLNAAHRKHLSKQLFEALDYLHQRGVLHRDIKAANILVSSDGILKLADFGLARFYAKRHQLDYTNRVITIWYRPPELLLGETQYSPAVDIWSAACVMIEIFTRRAIFAGDGGEISQLDKIYSVLGTPHKSDWPGLIDMPWFELLRPGLRKPNLFEEQYKDKLPPAAFDLMIEMLRYDPAKRPTAAEVLEHPYFTTEAPAPRQVIELQEIEGDWHEFESKALRRENEKKEREARKAAEKAESKDSKKRPPETSDGNRDSKRLHVEKGA